MSVILMVDEGKRKEREKKESTNGVNEGEREDAMEIEMKRKRG